MLLFGNLSAPVNGGVVVPLGYHKAIGFDLQNNYRMRIIFHPQDVPDTYLCICRIINLPGHCILSKSRNTIDLAAWDVDPHTGEVSTSLSRNDITLDPDSTVWKVRTILPQ